MGIDMNINLRFDRLIGVTDIPPMTIELRVGPPQITGTIGGREIVTAGTWLMRCEETGGQWVDAPVRGSLSVDEVRKELAVEWPLHRVEWPEQGGKYYWSDC